MHDPNGIIGARSASPLAPDSMAAIGQGLRPELIFFAIALQLQVHMRSKKTVLDRI